MVVDLRRLVSDLSPDHIPGEHLKVDLIRAGRQPQQAIGFLPDGDMVVVNDAEEMVGRTARGSRRPIDEADEPGPARLRPHRGRGEARSAGRPRPGGDLTVTALDAGRTEPAQGIGLPGGTGPGLVDLEPVLPEQGHETGSAQHPELEQLAVSCLEDLDEIAPAISDGITSLPPGASCSQAEPGRGGRRPRPRGRRREPSSGSPSVPSPVEDLGVEDAFSVQIATAACASSAMRSTLNTRDRRAWRASRFVAISGADLEDDVLRSEVSGLDHEPDERGL